MEYLNLSIRISSWTGGAYRVSATSPLGSAESTLALPFAVGDIAEIVEEVTDAVRGVQLSGSASPPSSAADSQAPLMAARVLGAQLYEALFNGPVRSLLDRSMGSIADRPDMGLRIRLAMDLKGPGMGEVACLPWELIAPGPSDIPVVLSKRSVLVRSLDVMAPSEPIPFEPPLRILTIVSNPTGTASLQLGEERSRIEESWGRLPDVRVDFVRPTVRAILDQVADTNYHVIHYMGHGDFDHASGEGALLLEHEDGSAHVVNSDQLRVLFDDDRLLRLVFLNACKSGTTGSHVDPFAGIATSLIKSGVPAVVAMQFPISDHAAIAFSDTFYRRIASGYPVDAAVAEARKGLWGGNSLEWATPVLFMRSKDGVLFDYDSTRSDPIDEGTRSSAEREPATAGMGQAAPIGWAGDSDAGFKLFLATPSDQLRPTHRRLSAELAASGFSVRSNEPPPFEENEHREAAAALTVEADLCVHLLGERPGEPMDDRDRNRTYPVEQLEIGLSGARSQLVLIPEQLDLENLEDAAYGELLRSLVERDREGDRFELVKVGRHQMLDEILAKQERILRSRMSSSDHRGAVETALVDLHATDVRHASELIGYLTGKQVAPVLIPTTDGAPAAAVSLFEETLRRVPLFIVVFGEVAREWVLGRLTTAAQFVTLNGLPTRIGVYVAPPEKGTEQLRFPPFYEVVSNMKGFDAGAVDALLQRAAGPA